VQALIDRLDNDLKHAITHECKMKVFVHTEWSIQAALMGMSVLVWQVICIVCSHNLSQ